MRFKWISNTYDPKSANAKDYVQTRIDQTAEEAWQKYIEWLADKRIGLPLASERYTVDELLGMNIVGVYAPVPTENAGTGAGAYEN